MNIKIVTDFISKKELEDIAQEFYAPMIKGVVDIEKEVIAFGGEYHMDANMVLIERGYLQPDIWGFNVYLDKDKDKWLEYTSLINIRPVVGNKDMYIENEEIREKIKNIVNKKING